MSELKRPADDDNGRSAMMPMQDVRERFVLRGALWVLVMSSLTAALAAWLHWQDPQARMLDRTAPLVLMAAFGALAWRQWRHPERTISTMWAGWFAMIIGLAVPTWFYVYRAWQGGVPLVQVLPPVAPVLLASLVVMALFAQPRDAWRAALAAWLQIAAPVLFYLSMHPAEASTPRGIELVLALGPVSLIVPMLIPMLRYVEQRMEVLRRESERLQTLSQRDPMTGLYNRRAGEDLLQALLANARDGAALILLDVDHFKRINDNHGHPAGDAVLIEIGYRCSQALGRDGVFARWGGEEFLVVLPGLGASEAAALAERLRLAIAAQPIAPVGRVSASFGVTSIRGGDTLHHVLQRVDSALYRAKGEGRDRVVVA